MFSLLRWYAAALEPHGGKTDPNPRRKIVQIHFLEFPQYRDAASSAEDRRILGLHQLGTGSVGLVIFSDVHNRVLGCRDLDAGGDGFDPVGLSRRPIPGNMYLNLFPKTLGGDSICRARHKSGFPRISIEEFLSEYLIGWIPSGADGQETAV